LNIENDLLLYALYNFKKNVHTDCEIKFFDYSKILFKSLGLDLSLTKKNYIHNNSCFLNLPQPLIDLNFDFINLNFFTEINSTRTINYNLIYSKINYEYTNFFFKFNYNKLNNNTGKRLFITKAILLPIDSNIHLIATSKDVIHS
jgi:hypothetical protein